MLSKSAIVRPCSSASWADDMAVQTGHVARLDRKIVAAAVTAGGRENNGIFRACLLENELDCGAVAGKTLLERIPILQYSTCNIEGE